MKLRSYIPFCIALASLAAYAAQPSPYAGQEARDIKAVSPEDVQSYLAGKGMGFAKAAELNGYPGPSHVLALASELGLDDAQRARTAALFATMEAEAIRYGRQLVEAERELDRLFASRQASAERVRTALEGIGALQARVRSAHLEAHVAQLEVLTSEQTARYAALRGYTVPRPAAASHEDRHH